MFVVVWCIVSAPVVAASTLNSKAALMLLWTARLDCSLDCFKMFWNDFRIKMLRTLWDDFGMSLK